MDERNCYRPFGARDETPSIWGGTHTTTKLPAKSMAAGSFAPSELFRRCLLSLALRRPLRVHQPQPGCTCMRIAQQRLVEVAVFFHLILQSKHVTVQQRIQSRIVLLSLHSFTRGTTFGHSEQLGKANKSLWYGSRGFCFDARLNCRPCRLENRTYVCRWGGKGRCFGLQFP